MKRSEERDDEPLPATPAENAKFIEASVAGIPNGRRKDQARAQMQAGLVVDPAKDDTAAIERVWAMCEEVSAKPSRKEFDKKFDEDHADFLRKLVCEDTQSGKPVGQGIIRNWISNAPPRSNPRLDFSVRLARGLLGADGEACPGATDFGQAENNRLSRSVAAAASVPGPQ